MGLKIEYIEGQTPLDEDEKEGLLFNKPVFSWGHSDLSKGNTLRKEYLEAIYKADNDDYKPLIEFAGK